MLVGESLVSNRSERMVLLCTPGKTLLAGYVEIPRDDEVVLAGLFDKSFFGLGGGVVATVAPERRLKKSAIEDCLRLLPALFRK